MESFVTFLFWYFVVICAFRLFVIAFAEYPRKLEFSRALDVLSFVLVLAITVWAYTVKYGV